MSSGVGIRLVCFVEQLLDPVEQAREAAAGLRGDRDHAGPLAQPLLDPRPHVLDLDLADVPLREDDERRAVRLAGDVGDGEVLVDEPLARVDEDERDVGAVGGVERAQLGVVLDPLPLLALAAQPGRVDEDERACRRARRRVSIASRVVPGTSETITRSSPRSAFRRLDLPTFGRPRIATRIASSPTAVGPLPGSRATIASSRSPVPWPCRAESGIGSPSPSRWNSSASTSRRGVVDLVREQEDRLPRGAQDLRDLLVAGGDPGLRVDDEEDEVGLARRRRGPARRSRA